MSREIVRSGDGFWHVIDPVDSFLVLDVQWTSYEEPVYTVGLEIQKCYQIGQGGKARAYGAKDHEWDIDCWNTLGGMLLLYREHPCQEVEMGHPGNKSTASCSDSD